RQPAQPGRIADEPEVGLLRQQLDERPERHGAAHEMGSFLARVARNHSAVPIWVMNTAVNTEVNTPIDSVQAKPRTGPAPNWNMIRAATRVVRLASRMVAMARVKPASAAKMADFPARASSRIRS